MTAPAFKLAIVTNDVSGDMLGATLVRALRHRLGDRELQVVAMGGEMLRAEGCELVFSIDELRGWGQGVLLSLFKIRRLLKVRRSLFGTFRAWQPDVFVGIDASDFNLKLAEQLRREGIRTVQYVSPSVWMWRKYRAARVARSVDLLLALYKFEKQYYAGLPLTVEVVGHPLAGSHKPCTVAEARARLGVATDGKWLCLLFGSRDRELDVIGRYFVKIAAACHRQMPQLQFITAAPSARFAEKIKKLWQSHLPQVPLRVEIGKVPQMISACDAVLLCNGTVALEAMFLHRPMVSVYKVGNAVAILLGLLFPHIFIGIGLVGRARPICLPNIMAGRFVVPEFVQYRLKTELAAARVVELLQPGDAAEQQHSQLSQLAADMPTDCSDRAAAAILRLAASG